MPEGSAPGQAKGKTMNSTPEIHVGQHATLSYPQDSYPLVVTKVSPSGKTAWFDRVKEVSLDSGHKPEYQGPYPSWNHTYTDDEVQALRMEGCETKATLRKDGVWRVAGTTSPIRLGSAVYRRDFSL